MILIIAAKLKLNFSFFPWSIRVVDLLTPYLLLSVTIQTKMANLDVYHLYFYIFLNFFGIALASYLTFRKKRLVLSKFFRAWWRYTFIFAFIYHLVVGGYGLYIHLL